MSNLKYEEFVKLCDDAGIGADDPAEMESDYATGAALADIVTELEKTSAGYTPTNTVAEAIRRMETVIDVLYAGEMPYRESAIKLGVEVIRFLAEHCETPEAS